MTNKMQTKIRKVMQLVERGATTSRALKACGVNPGTYYANRKKIEDQRDPGQIAPVISPTLPTEVTIMLTGSRVSIDIPRTELPRVLAALAQ